MTAEPCLTALFHYGAYYHLDGPAEVLRVLRVRLWHLEQYSGRPTEEIQLEKQKLQCS